MIKCISMDRNESELMSEEEKKDNLTPEFKLNHSVRWLVYFQLVLFSLLINVDHGIIPASLNEIQKELNQNKTEIGLLSMLVFAGIFVGSLLILIVINTWNRKILLVVSAFLGASALVLSHLFRHRIEVMYVCRFVIGLSQVSL